MPLHLIWRKAYYRAWLPNTYYAKSEGFWPQAGIRYSLSFVIEYSLWIWLLLAVLWAVKTGTRRRSRNGGGRSPSTVKLPVPLLAVLGVIIGQFGFYTFVIGGDHFEYRIYSHLILLLFLTGVWLVDRVFKTRRAAVCVMILFLGLSLPIPWVHWAATHNLKRSEEEAGVKHPVAGYFPGPLRGYVGLFDGLQGWLNDHMVCWRHREHQLFYETQIANFPSRADGGEISWDGQPVLIEEGVGVPGWVLPNVAIVDAIGLNDYVIARNWKEHLKRGRMAHNRWPPKGYLDEIRPNVEVVRLQGDGVQVVVYPRTEPLAPADIVAWEEKWWGWIDRKRAGK
jgi:arabinofuranosyltransferase